MPKRTVNLIITGISLLVVCGLLVIWMLHPSAPEATGAPGVTAEIVHMPSGRILNVVVEEDGAYIGKEFMPFLLFEKHLKEHRGDLRASYVIVVGTENARYGSAVRIYDAVRSVLRVPSTIETRVLPVGTRREAIEVRRNSWGF